MSKRNVKKKGPDEAGRRRAAASRSGSDRAADARLLPAVTGWPRRRGGPVPDSPHCFGSHRSIAGGVHHALEAALALGFRTAALFVKNQRQWRAGGLDPADLARFRELAATPGFGPVVAHATYLINLASADERLWCKSRDAFAEELARCHALGIPYLVVHPGAAVMGPAAKAVRRVARALDEIYAARPELAVITLLETTAGQGSALGHTFAELAEIRAALRRPERVGICIDTCHVFAAGWDIRRAEVYHEMIATAAREVGLERIRAWHVNDSAAPLGARVDRHAHIGAGCLGAAGFRHLLADDRFHGLPLILETPKGVDAAGRDLDLLNLQRLRRIAARLRSRADRA